MPRCRVTPQRLVEELSERGKRVRWVGWQSQEPKAPRAARAVERSDKRNHRHVLGRRDPEDAVGEQHVTIEQRHRPRCRAGFGNVDQREHRYAGAKLLADPVARAADIDHRGTAGVRDLFLPRAHERTFQRCAVSLRIVDRRRYERHAMAGAAQETKRPEPGAVMKPDEHAGTGWKRIAIDTKMACHPAIAAEGR